MAIDILVPPLGEGIPEAMLAIWLSRPGDHVATNQPVAELQTDTVTEEILAPTAGVLTRQLVSAGERVRVGDVVATMEPDARQR